MLRIVATAIVIKRSEKTIRYFMKTKIVLSLTNMSFKNFNK